MKYTWANRYGIVQSQRTPSHGAAVRVTAPCVSSRIPTGEKRSRAMLDSSRHDRGPVTHHKVTKDTKEKTGPALCPLCLCGAHYSKLRCSSVALQTSSRGPAANSPAAA